MVWHYPWQNEKISNHITMNKCREHLAPVTKPVDELTPAFTVTFLTCHELLLPTKIL